MYTEEEIKEKVCCGESAAFCVASLCMAWRWCDDIKHCSNCNDMSIFDRVEGYCGLAGKP